MISILTSSFAQSLPLRLQRDATWEEQQKALSHNQDYFFQNQNILKNQSIPLQRPVEEYANYKYLLIQGDDIYYGLDKTDFAKNLPKDMSLVVLADRSTESYVRSKFAAVISRDRLIVATHPTAQLGFWARDSFPYPVIGTDKRNSLVSHRYYRPFEGQKAVADSVHALSDSYDFIFVGGNLMADSEGNCFVIKSSRLYGTPTEVIKKAHGCVTLTELPWVSGIGDVDEVVKLLPNKNALTNDDKIAKILEEKGYTVTMLPKAEGYRTYANSLIVSDTVFMPSYKTAQDDEAEAVYAKFGYRVVKIDSRDISDNGHGSIHCITMAYPEMDIRGFLKTQGYSF